MVALDSLRGLAAVAVVVWHCLLTFGWTGPLDHPGLRLVMAGPGAVVLFFVLSGLVLSKTYVDKDRRYLPYIIKRLARVYLPFLAAVMLAAGLSASIGHAPLSTASDWFNRLGWHSRVDGGLLTGHLITGGSVELDNAIWSLIQEIRLSLVVPLIALATLRNWKAALAGSWLLAAAAALFERSYGQPDALLAWPNTIIYAPLFSTGATIALVGQPWLDRLRRLARGPTLLLIVAGLLALSYSQIGGNPQPLVRPFLMLAAETAGAALILSFAMIDTWMTRRVLDTAVPRYLGRISYSLYLLHLPVLESLVRLLDGRAPHWVPILLVAPVSIAAAHLFHQTVEVGSQRLGRHLAQRVTRDRRVAESGFGTA